MLGHVFFHFCIKRTMFFLRGTAQQFSYYTTAQNFPNRKKKSNDFGPLNHVGKSTFCFFWRPQQKGHEKTIFVVTLPTESLQGPRQRNHCRVSKSAVAKILCFGCFPEKKIQLISTTTTTATTTTTTTTRKRANSTLQTANTKQQTTKDFPG